MSLLLPWLSKREYLAWLRQVPVDAWVVLFLGVGSAPLLAIDVVLFWPDLLS